MLQPFQWTNRERAMLLCDLHDQVVSELVLPDYLRKYYFHYRKRELNMATLRLKSLEPNDEG